MATEQNAAIQSLNELVDKVKAAQVKFATYTQEQVDKIFRYAALCANAQRIPLAQAAFDETGMGLVEDKVIKNHFASEYIYHKYCDMKTCGVIAEDNEYGTQTLAEPIGVVAAIVPTTNPTSTAIFKCLICLKTRNGVVFSPHPRAKKSTIQACKVVLDAAVKAGAPENIIGWIEEPTIELSNALMNHPHIDLILATGGPGMVKAAYSAGKPALGVGPGDVPVVIDETADIKRAVAQILMSKTFDNGMICASEQAVIVVDAVYEQVKARFASHKAYILNKEEHDKVANVMFPGGAAKGINASIVGMSAPKIASMAGITVPEDTKILIGEGAEISLNEAFSREKLSPTLGMFHAKDFKDAVDIAEKMVVQGGLGHSSCLYTDQEHNADRIAYFGEKMNTGRILINQPTSHGGIGDLYNFNVNPSLTLGCGSWGGNSVSENVGPMHLINKKVISKREENMLWHRLPGKIYFRRGCLPVALRELSDKKRAVIVTDSFLYKSGMAKPIVDCLKAQGTDSQVFSEVPPDPTLSVVRKLAQLMHTFQPDTIIALGGGSPMDAAKVAWVMYEHPDVDFADLALRFMDIRKRIYVFPKMGSKANLVCVPTTSGTGSEVTPFAIVTDDSVGIKYPLADYELTPNMSIVDPNFVMTLPKGLCAFGGIDAIVHCLEAYVSIMHSEFSDGQAIAGLKLLKEYLPDSYVYGSEKPVAREKVHYAATLAGIAFANAFLGVCHSMAHKIGSEFHIPHGLANAFLIMNVLRYNANDNPSKQATFSQIDRPTSLCRYAEVAVALGLTKPEDDTAQKRFQRLLDWMQSILDVCQIPKSIKEYLDTKGIGEDKFLAALDKVSVMAFDDQCTGANPRYPLIKEIKQMLLDSYYGRVYHE